MTTAQPTATPAEAWLEALGHGVLVLDGARRVRWFNPPAAALLGVASGAGAGTGNGAGAGAGSLNGQPLAALLAVPPGWPDPAATGAAQGLQATPTAGRRTLDATAQALADGGWVISLADVSARVEREQALHASEARFRSLTELSADWYWEQDERFRYLRFEGREIESLGLSRDYLGKTPWQVETPNLSATDWAAHRARLEAREEFRGLEIERPQPGGGSLWISVSGKPVFDREGRYRGYHGVGRVITERKRAQQALQNQLDFIQRLTRRVPGMLYQLRMTGGGWFSFPYASDGIRELFEIEPEDVRDDAAPLYRRLVREDFEAAVAGMREAARKLLPWEGEYRVQLSEGRLRWHATRATPYAEADGAVIWYGFTRDITEQVQQREQLERALQAQRANEERLRLVLQGSSDGAWDWNIETGENYFAPRWWEMLGYAPGDLPADGEIWGQLIHPFDRLRVQAEIDAAMQEGAPSFEIEFTMLRRDGTPITVLDRGVIVRDATGRPRRVSGTLTDLSARKRLEHRLEESEAQLRTLFDAVPGRLWFKNLEGRFVLCNAEVADAYGHSISEMIGRTPAELGADEAASSQHDETDQAALDGAAPVRYEAELPIYPRGPKRLFSVTKRAVFDNAGQPLGVLGVAHDITERKQAEVQIERLAFYDPLTGLCNRRLFQNRLEQAQAASARHSHWCALCFIDLDNFKDLNDTLGHDVGDMLLVQVGQRLSEVVRDQDTVARLGGDEFVVLLEDMGTDDDQIAVYANTVGQKVLQALNRPYDLKGRPHHNTPSIGITLFRGNDESVEDILKRADLAMYQSKSAGRNTVRFFDPHMQAVVLERSALERDLREAIAQRALLLYFQPVVGADRQVLGHEALLRWKHPVRGMVSPAEFIPVAEQTALILPIGHWVLQEAFTQLAAWQHDKARRHWTLAVNLSARQLRQADFVDVVRRLLAETGAPPRQLKLELTESLLLHDTSETIVKMQQLAELGIRFSLDDFGTGYSSLSYLKRLPLSQLKIDQSFVRDLLSDPNDAAIARTIMQLAHSLELDVVAEGVETEGQLESLKAMGCQAFQGYLFGQPAPLPPAAQESPR